MKRSVKKKTSILNELNNFNKELKIFELINSKDISWKKKIFNPLLYKKIFCKNYFTSGKCNLNCHMAYSIKELNEDLKFKIKDINDILFYYKTKFCPFIKFEHKFETFIFSHGLLDYRRTYSSFLYGKKCLNFENFWKNYQKNKDPKLINIQNICKNYNNCKFIHSFHEYHLHLNIIKNKNFNRKICGKILIENKNIILKNSENFVIVKKNHNNYNN